MADLRLIALALVACADASARDLAARPDAHDAPPATSGVKWPVRWTAQPGIAAAAKTALGRAGEGVEAFGEPAMGCYGVWMTMRASGEATDVAEQLLRGLVVDAKAKRSLAIKDVVKPTAAEGPQGIVSLRFESSPYRGRLRARVGKGRIVALACFASQREPAACETACTVVLGAMP